ncbi:cytochrome c [Ramlibacter sp. AW1]|uniref:Cytochrome c n=1 Tax=Ramlibacter aurantiacus TaxID=2801330 RepID=A0A937D626_9BURK|nr:cytochrome c [Ramlibacter aurantiacus]MBL0423305.1 cytochrome c [Ramlibacter aurantiacus]
MSLKSICTALSVAGLALASVPASAQFSRPEDAVRYRQSAMSLMNAHMGRIGAMVNGRVPYNGAAALENAEVVALVSRLPWSAFGPETDKLSRRAKPEIWTEQAKFQQLGEKATAEAARLLAAAKTQNLDNLKSAFQATVNSCNACHDDYRNR